MSESDPSRADGTAYPFVEDLGGAWHMRPPNDLWVAGVDEPNAQGLCGPLHSVHVSAYAPDDGEHAQIGLDSGRHAGSA